MYEKLSQLPKWQKEDISESTPNKSKENTDKESKATLYELWNITKGKEQTEKNLFKKKKLLSAC